MKNIKNPEQNRKRKALMLTILMGTATLFFPAMFTACKNPKGGGGENLSQSVTNFRGVKIVKEFGVTQAQYNQIFGWIQAMYTYWDNAGFGDDVTFEGHINEIRIKPGAAITKSGSILNVGGNVSAASLDLAMSNIVDFGNVSKLFDNTEIRLVNGKTTTVGEIAAMGKKFHNAKDTIAQSVANDGKQRQG